MHHLMWQTLFYCCPLYESLWQTQCKNNMVYARRTVKENHRPLQNADVLFLYENLHNPQKYYIVE